MTLPVITDIPMNILPVFTNSTYILHVYHLKYALTSNIVSGLFSKISVISCAASKKQKAPLICLFHVMSSVNLKIKTN